MIFYKINLENVIFLDKNTNISLKINSSDDNYIPHSHGYFVTFSHYNYISRIFLLEVYFCILLHLKKKKRSFLQISFDFVPFNLLKLFANEKVKEKKKEKENRMEFGQFQCLSIIN